MQRDVATGRGGSKGSWGGGQEVVIMFAVAHAVRADCCDLDTLSEAHCASLFESEKGEGSRGLTTPFKSKVWQGGDVACPAGVALTS